MQSGEAGMVEKEQQSVRRGVDAETRGQADYAHFRTPYEGFKESGWMIVLACLLAAIACRNESMADAAQERFKQ